jgi:hypothetical protein
LEEINKMKIKLSLLVVILVFCLLTGCCFSGWPLATSETTVSETTSADNSAPETDETETTAKETTSDSSAETTAKETTSDSSAETTAPETIAPETTAAETTAAETTAPETAAPKVAPTIELKIYEGPTFSAADSVCYYKLEAVVTGNPKPVVAFSKDNSNGAWGSKKVQINLNAGESYTLRATATNSEGSATVSKNLTYGCAEGANKAPVLEEIIMLEPKPETNSTYDISVVASDPDDDLLTYNWSVDAGTLASSITNPTKWKTPAEAGEYIISVFVSDGNGHTVNKTKNVIVELEAAVFALEKLLINFKCVGAEGGFIEQGGAVYAGNNLYAGDSNNNKSCTGLISFDISRLAGKNANVLSAQVSFLNSRGLGNPLDFAPYLSLSSYYWGPRVIQNGDDTANGEILQTFEPATFACFNDELINALQNALNAGRPRFQLRINFAGGLSTDNDNSWDGWEYTQNNVNLSAWFGSN